MGEKTAISWCDATFNPWWGCVKVSPGCDHCYAETFDHRVGGDHWGYGKPRKTFTDKHWAEPLKWNRKAEADGVRRRVFCGSMCDVMDDEAPEGARERLYALIRATPALDWLLLTKRPHNYTKYLPADWGDGYPNAWLGTTVEGQEQTFRIDQLHRMPSVVYWLSVEPMIGPLNLSHWLDILWLPAGWVKQARWMGSEVDWVIVGGESGPGFRGMEEAWARDLRDQCAAAGVAFFFKQSSGPKAGMGATLDGKTYHEFPEVRR